MNVKMTHSMEEKLEEVSASLLLSVEMSSCTGTRHMFNSDLTSL